jgi:hypothetical protein
MILLRDCACQVAHVLCLVIVLCLAALRPLLAYWLHSSSPCVQVLLKHAGVVASRRCAHSLCCKVFWTAVIIIVDYVCPSMCILRSYLLHPVAGSLCTLCAAFTQWELICQRGSLASGLTGLWSLTVDQGVCGTYVTALLLACAQWLCPTPWLAQIKA